MRSLAEVPVVRKSLPDAPIVIKPLRDELGKITFAAALAGGDRYPVRHHLVRVKYEEDVSGVVAHAGLVLISDQMWERRWERWCKAKLDWQRGQRKRPPRKTAPRPVPRCTHGTIVLGRDEACELLGLRKYDGVVGLVGRIEPGKRLHWLVDMISDRRTDDVLRERMVLVAGRTLIRSRGRVGRDEAFLVMHAAEMPLLIAVAEERGWELRSYDWAPRGRTTYRRHDEAVLVGTVLVGGKPLPVKLKIYPSSAHRGLDVSSPDRKAEVQWRGRRTSTVDWQPAPAIRAALEAELRSLAAEARLTPLSLNGCRGTKLQSRHGKYEKIALQVADQLGSVSQDMLVQECQCRGLTCPSRPDEVLKRLVSRGELEKPWSANERPGSLPYVRRALHPAG